MIERRCSWCIGLYSSKVSSSTRIAQFWNETSTMKAYLLPIRRQSCIKTMVNGLNLIINEKFDLSQQDLGRPKKKHNSTQMKQLVRCAVCLPDQATLLKKKSDSEKLPQNTGKLGPFLFNKHPPWKNGVSGWHTLKPRASVATNEENINWQTCSTYKRIFWNWWEADYRTLKFPWSWLISSELTGWFFSAKLNTHQKVH